MNQLSPIVSMETVTAVGVGGTIVEENGESGDGDDSPMLLPAITKKVIIFDEEDELQALDSELDSRDDLDKISQRRLPNIPRASIDKSYATPAKEDHVYDKTISSPLIEDKDGGESKIMNGNRNSVKVNVGTGINAKEDNSVYLNHSSTQNQRQNCVGNGDKLQISKSENGITQTLIERRSLLPLLTNTNNVNNNQLGNSNLSNSSSAITSTNKHEATINDNRSSTAAHSANGNNDAPGR